MKNRIKIRKKAKKINGNIRKYKIQQPGERKIEKKYEKEKQINEKMRKKLRMKILKNNKEAKKERLKEQRKIHDVEMNNEEYRLIACE